MESELHTTVQKLEMSLARVSHLSLLKWAALIRNILPNKALMRLMHALQD